MKICIIQARMGSSRLPGKVLKPIIEDIPSLYLQYERISPSQKIDKLIIATSTLPQDDIIEYYCNQWQIPVFRGDEQNVLKRFYEAATLFQADTIIRVTADCPLHHYQVIDWCIEQFEKQQVDYFSNSNEPPVLEDGWDTEVFTYQALKTAYFEATKNYEQEHVTPYIKQSGKFKCIYQKFLSNNPHSFKLSVDNENDYKLIQSIFAHFYPNILFTVSDIIKLLKEKPALLEINKTSVINEGYQKSISEDTKNKK
ncbi:MAG: glycosyltransferase family protein [Bacteroidia bacterium]|nr:glycosyltransferase family protein [Bacteroidia bacterium]